MTGEDRQRGQATVELVLVLPVVVLLALLVAQAAVLARDQLLVFHAAREAARAAAIDPEPSAAGAAAEAASDLRADRLSTEVQGRGDPGSRVRAVVRYRAPTDVPLVGPLLGDVTLEGAATMRVE